MITELAEPETILYQLVIAAENDALTDTDPLDYMARFYDLDDDTESAESPSTEASRDRAWEIYG